MIKIMVHVILFLLSVNIVSLPVLAQTSTDLKVISYNIHKGWDKQTEATLAKIADLIYMEQADVVGIQELENKYTTPSKLTLTRLKELSGWVR